MTKQQKWTPESPIEACATTYESLAKALGGLQNKFEIPEAAREFVKRSAAAARTPSGAPPEPTYMSIPVSGSEVAMTPLTSPSEMRAMRAPAARKRAFDGLAHRNIDALTEEWVRPGLTNPAVAEDLRQFTLSLRTEVTTGVAARLNEFDKPALIAWSADDTFFELADGEKLAATIPNARLEVIEGARTFSMVDQPGRLADLLSTIAVRA